jgi:SAM-dependent methyltransferase
MQPADVSARVSTAVVDATDPVSLGSLDGGFDLVVADMVLMNLVDLVPLARAMPRLLAHNGRFAPLVLHPSFPSPFFVEVDAAGRPTGAVSKVVALPLDSASRRCLLLKPFFDAGLVLHGLFEGADDGGTEPGMLWLDLRRARVV